MWEAVVWCSEWYVSYPNGLTFRREGWNEQTVREWCARINAREQLERRKNAALDRAIVIGVSEADIFKAID